MYITLLGAAGLLGLNLGYLFHPLWALLLVGSGVLFYGTTVLVPLNHVYLWWTPMAYLVGVVTSLYATNVQNLAPFFTSDNLLRTPLRAWRLLLPALCTIGASVAWALMPQQPWFWTVPLLINVMVVWLTFRLLPHVTYTVWSRIVWLLLNLSYCAVVGLLSTLVSMELTPLYVFSTLIAQSSLIGILLLLGGLWTIFTLRISDEAFVPLESVERDSEFAYVHHRCYSAA